MNRMKTFTDRRGSLTVVESGKDIPFEVKRAYWIYGLRSEVENTAKLSCVLAVFTPP